MLCRTQRTIAIAASVLWLASFALMFAPLLTKGDPRTVLIIAAVNVGAIAACLSTVAVLPYLLRDMFEQSVTDYMGTYLAGWAARGERDEPREPTRSHLSAVR